VRTSVTVAPVTRTMRGIPVEVTLGREHGLPAKSIANLDDIATIPKALLGSRITTLPPAKMHEVSEAMRFALDL
jgi:mRNA interferase MazF